MLLHGKRFEVRKAYPNGAEGRLVSDQQLIQELEKYLVKNIHDACERNINPRAKPKSLDKKFDVIYKRVFTDFL